MSAKLDREETDNNDQHEHDESEISTRRRQVLSGIGAAGLASVFGLGSTEVAVANDAEMMDDN
ncbi:hypothetical protein ACTXP3_27410, partial [Klebsiella pneumoniae]|uniref:hypothetical protein n=1 Tax=Klebsiella pneumoniae TaxID=573 RepID=UPI003FD0C4A6